MRVYFNSIIIRINQLNHKNQLVALANEFLITNKLYDQKQFHDFLCFSQIEAHNVRIMSNIFRNAQHKLSLCPCGHSHGMSPVNIAYRQCRAGLDLSEGPFGSNQCQAGLIIVFILYISIFYRASQNSLFFRIHADRSRLTLIYFQNLLDVPLVKVLIKFLLKSERHASE